MMKRLFKVFLFMLIVNGIGLAGLVTWLSASSIAPSFKDSGITFSDIFKKDLDPAKQAKLEKSINEKSQQLGKSAAEKVISGLKVLIPSAEVDYSKIPAAPYPYASTDEVFEKINKVAAEGAAEGLRIANETEKQNEAIKKKALAEAQAAADNQRK